MIIGLFKNLAAVTITAGILVTGIVDTAGAGEEVNVYSYRQPDLVAPLFDRFTEKTGIKVNMIFAKKGLIERMVREDKRSPADVLLTVDIGRLTGAKSKGVTQAIASERINANIPAAYRDSEGHWIGLTTRARVVYASRQRVKQSTITYEELAAPKWKARIWHTLRQARLQRRSNSLNDRTSWRGQSQGVA